MNTENIFIQVHIPRTAGTSFQNHIGDAYSRNNGTCWQHYNYCEGLSYPIYSWNDIPVLRHRTKEQQKQLKVISGHSVFANSHHWLRVSRNPLFITFVRDPVKRVLSSFNHRHSRHILSQEPGVFSASPLMNTNAVAGGATANDYDTLWQYYKDAFIEHNLQSKWIIKTFLRLDNETHCWQPHPTYDGNFHAMATLPVDNVPITLPEWMWWDDSATNWWEVAQPLIEKFWWISANENLTEDIKDFCNFADIPFEGNVYENRTGEKVPGVWSYEEVMQQPNIQKLIDAESDDYELYNYVKKYARRPF